MTHLGQKNLSFYSTHSCYNYSELTAGVELCTCLNFNFPTKYFLATVRICLKCLNVELYRKKNQTVLCFDSLTVVFYQ